MIGCHLSVAGGLHHALVEAAALKLECVQVFTQNQRQWKARRLTREALDLWRRRRVARRPVVSHAGYLINLAAADPALRRRSIAALRSELRRCEALGIGVLVLHGGAHNGAGEAHGLDRVIRSINRVHRGLPDGSTVLCLETTAGAGTTLCGTLEHLAFIRRNVDEPGRVGVCLDTAHLFAAGYDLSGAAQTQDTLQRCEAVLGWDAVRAAHINDSKTPLGSRRDRHEHIGHGHIPLEAFAEVVNHAYLRTIPLILETPKAVAPDGRSWDEVNLAVLRGLLE
ncbi:MAG: deoxyribonuclease IV [Planctomycetes bacterium]|nr:deoxyribonuclease IV [Planctomycetota bacterium]